MRSYDAIVVGLGAMGSATLYHLALGGRHVLGLEQFKRGHELGSSHGDSRVIREQYFEHPLYVPIVQRAYELWRELEARTESRLMTLNGGLMIGPPDGMVVGGTLRSAAEFDLPHEVLTAAQVSERFPAFRLAEELIAVWDPRAGFLEPESCNAAHIDGARRASAEVRFEEPVIQWAPDGDGVRVQTSSGVYFADRLLFSAGAWSADLLRDLRLPLTVERQVAFWLEPDESMVSYDKSYFPIYAYEYIPGSVCYGFPRLARGVKASVMHSGELSSTPRDVRRTVEESEVKPLRRALAAILPSLARARVLDSGVCLFTNTPDHDFIVDFHPQYHQVLVSSPCSGHGFKFASALGEIQAELLTTGRTRFDISPFRIDRFSDGLR